MKKILFSIVTVCTFMLGTTMASHQGRIGYSGGPQELNCTACHSDYAVNSGPGSVSITSNMNNWQYTPGQTYTIALTVHQTGMQRFGMAFEANKDTAMIGTLTSMSPTDSITIWRLRTITFEGTGRAKYGMTHNRWNIAPAGQPVQYYYPATQPDFYTWYFKWTAPSTDQGALTFWFTGLAADSMDNLPGDYTYTSSQVITPTTPEVTVAPLSIIDFTGSTTLASAAQTATFSGQYLTENVKIQAPDEFKVSLTGLQGSWVKRITVAKGVDGTIAPTTFYIKYFPTVVGTAAYYVRLIGATSGNVYTKIRVKGVATAKFGADVTEEFAVTLTPSPAVNTLNVALSNADQNTTISIFDLAGNKLQSIVSGSSNSVAMDISQLSKGLYFCRVEAGSKVTIKKFVKQ